MNREELAHCVQLMYDTFNQRDVQTADKVFAPDFYSHPLHGGIESVKQSWSAIQKTFPDIKVVVEEMIIDVHANSVASRTRIDGMPADTQGNQPTIMEFIRIKNGRIVEIRGLTNLK